MRPPVVPSLGPCQTEMSSGQDSPLALLDWHPHTSPHFIHRLQEWVKSHPLGSSLLPRFQVLELGGRIPMAPRSSSALCPVWLWNRGCPFQSRQLLLLLLWLLLSLKPFTSDRDSNPHGWDSNPAKTHSTWFRDLMKLRFLMTHHRKNSVRDKVIGKKWIYSDTERSTLYRQNVGNRRGWMQAAVKCGMVSFYRLGNFRC